jgi:hypothetical protein
LKVDILEVDILEVDVAPITDLENSAEFGRLLLELGLRVLVALEHRQRVVRCLQAVHARVDEVFVNFDLKK